MNTRILRILFNSIIASIIPLLLLTVQVPTPAASAPPPPMFHFEVAVTTTTDEYNTGTECSLREAIKTMNDGTDFGGCVFDIVPGGGPSTVFVPSGTYTLTQENFFVTGEDVDETGDLDIRSSILIRATGAPTPTVTQGLTSPDRIFHVVIGTVTIQGLAIRGGSVSSGGGGGVRVNSGTSLSLIDSEISSNTPSGNGGGIYNSGTVILTNVTLSGNTASTGAGIYNDATATLTNVTLDGNIAGGSGGGIYNYSGATTTLTNVTLSGNSASGGGGILNNGTLRLTNVTLSGNSASNGGGIYNYDFGSAATLINVTLSANSATTLGGGIYNNFGTTALTNTIVANSSTGGNCSPALGGSHNLSTDNTCNFGGFGMGLDNAPVMLGPLANNGGTTQTHALLPGSPAINFGTNTGCPSTDQRGAHRPIGTTCDVGAYEAGYLFLPLILR